MQGASDLKDTIPDLEVALYRETLVIKQVKEHEQDQFKRAEKEGKRASLWKTTAEVMHQCKRAAEEQTKFFKEAKKELTAKLEDMRHNYLMEFAHATTEVKLCLYCLVHLI